MNILWLFLLFSHVQLFVTPWTVARQASLYFTISPGLLKLVSLESVMLSSHLVLCRPLLLLPSIIQSRTFLMSQLFTLGDQSTGVSASASDLPVNIQDWFPLGWTGWITSHFSNSVFKISLRLLFVHLLVCALLSSSMSTILHPGHSDLLGLVSLSFYIYALQALLTVELKCSLINRSHCYPTFSHSVWPIRK